jgi:hypothetical protein
MDDLAGPPPAAAAPTGSGDPIGHLANIRYVICNYETHKYLFRQF